MSLLTTATGTKTTTWSYQLQFNFKFNKSPLLLLRTRLPNSNRCCCRSGRLSVRCVAQDEAKSGSDSERRSGDNSNSSWTGLGNGDVDWFGNSGSSQQKQGIGGILGVGLASVLLVAGITSAALSIGKRSSSRPRQEMEPLTQQEETLVTSVEGVHWKEEIGHDVDHSAQEESNLQNGRNLESKAGTENGIASSSDSPVDNTELKLSDLEKSALTSADYSIQESGSNLLDSNSLDMATTSPDFPPLEYVDETYMTSSYIDSQDTAAGSITGEDLDDVGLNVSSVESLNTDGQQGTLEASQTDALPNTLESPSSTAFRDDSEALASNSDATLLAELETSGDVAISAAVLTKEDVVLPNAHPLSGYENGTIIGNSNPSENGASDAVTFVAESSAANQNGGSDVVGERSVLESQSPNSTFTSRGIPAPSLLSAALQAPPGKVLVPAVADQTQAQALSALQVLKVIESDAQAGDLCTRREYARWLVSASSVLSRNLILKVYPAMYIENFTELAYDDITPEDPDFISIQGLAEAGLISSKLSRRDMVSSPDEDIGSFSFHPDSPLSRQDLVTWKMALEKRQLPETDRKALHQLSGFIDIDRIDLDAVPALVADISAGDQGIMALAFGYTRLFQPDKPVTKGQAAIALATGEAADIVSEELARIEAESMADKAVAAHNALVAEVEKDVNVGFEKELLMEREKIDAVQRMAEEATLEVERLRAEREEQNSALMKGRAAVESEMEVLSRLRHELEEQLQSLMSNKVEISYEKERTEKLRKETEEENQAITRLQYELEVERKALSMARTWAEDEARRVQEHAKALEEARDRWERRGIKVVVDEDLRDNAVVDVTWSNVGKKLALEDTVERAETLTDKLKLMGSEVKGKSKEVVNKIIEKIQLLISAIKEWISKATTRTTELRDVAFVKTGEFVQQFQQHTADLGTSVKEGAKRVIDDCRGGVDKLTQRFKT